MKKTENGFFKIHGDRKIKLTHYRTDGKLLYKSDDDYKLILAKDHQRLEDYQNLLYANQSRSILVIFQGMDTSGKDGAIKHVMSGINPQGCLVVSFKAPTATELEHDFLWKSNQSLPARGQIGIFNRSYYEETLITRVHPQLLLKEKLPISKTGKRFGKKFWNHRYQDIVHHEEYLQRQGTSIVKIFIHISKDEQKKRLMDRFSDPKKVWKISEGDVTERGFWSEYQMAYEECLQKTSTKNCPWHIVPGDDKKNARLMISQILLNHFHELNLKTPKLNAKSLEQLRKLKILLTKD